MTRAVTPGQMLPTLTGVRGFAALMVVFYHIRGGMTGFLPDRVISVLAQGYLAVDLFFVLSGFVLWWTYGNQFRDRGLRAAPHFIVRRFARIFPLHLAVLSAMLLFAAALIVSGRDPGEHYSFAELPAHYLLVQNWGFSDRLTWNDPAWSISTEWAAYLLLAITGGWLARLPRGAWSFPLLIIAMAAALGWWFAATGRASIGDDIPATGLLRCLVEFGIGILLCQWWTAQRQGPRSPAIIYGTALGLIGVAALLFGVAGSQPAAVPLFMTAVVILALQASTAPRPFLSGRIAQWLGDISYAVYLSHFFLWILFKLFFVDDPARVHPAMILAFTLLTLAASHLLHIALEVPGRRIARAPATACSPRRALFLPRAAARADPPSLRQDGEPSAAARRYCSMSAPRLIHVDDSLPGISRTRSGVGWLYRDAKGKIIRDRDEIDRLNAIALPPAYEDAWFCPAPNGHILATGYDARGRKQYRYHPDFRIARDADKYDRCAAFGHALPLLRARLEGDLNRRTLCSERVVAAVVRLLDLAALRVGNEQYVAANKSFGATTLRQRHAKLSGKTLRLKYIAKGGAKREVTISDRSLTTLVRRLQDLPGQHLFQYDDGDGICAVASEDVNAYIREAMGDEFSAKHFRTWSASVEAFAFLYDAPEPPTLKAMLEHVAGRLGNTPAIARKAYVHPAMLAAAQAREDFAASVGSLPRATRYLSRYERGFLTYLEQAPAAAVLLQSA